MKRFCNSPLAVCVLSLYAAFAALDGLLVTRSAQDYLDQSPMALAPTRLPGLFSNAAADEPAHQLLPPVEVAESEATVEVHSTGESSDSAKSGSNEPAFDLRRHFTTRLSVVDSEIAVAQARAAQVQHAVESERKIETAELVLQIATRNRERYTKGESQREQSSLENQVQLAEDRYRQLEERLAWSESLANGGLITQGALEIDVSAVKGSESELRAAEARLTVFKTIDLERFKTQLEARFLSAQAELELLRWNAKGRSLELQSNNSAAQRNLKFVQARVEELNEESLPGAQRNKNDPVQVASERQGVKVAQSALRRAERELATMKEQVDVTSVNGERMHKVQELQLDAFRKSRQSGTLHELSSRIRILSEELAADQQQLAWSRRVIRKGYITATELRSAELAVKKREAELTNVRQQKTILSEHTLERDEFELTEKLRHASNELDRHKRLAKAKIHELSAMADARRQALAIRKEWYVILNGQWQETVAAAGGG